MLLLFAWLSPTWAQVVPPPPEPAVRTEMTTDGLRILPDRQVPVAASEAERLLLEFGETSLFELTLFFSDVLRKNMLLADAAPLKAKRVTLIGHESMTLEAAWEAYLSALRAHGFTTSVVGELVTIVPSTEASSRSEGVRSGAPTAGERIVTQLLPVPNGDVSDLLPIVKPLLSGDAEVIAYAPANTLIVTDSANNVLKIADLVAELSVAAPTTTLRLYPLVHAQASEVREVLLALYPEVDTQQPAEPARRRAPTSRRSPEAPAPTTSGEPARHITKVIEHERTNSLFVLANAVGHEAVVDIVAQIDVDHAASSSTLHIYRLQYALAQEVRAVLAELQGGAAADAPARNLRNAARTGREAEGMPDLAEALDSGARIAADPATNALAILAQPQDYRAIADLVAALDTVRRQVFVDALFVDLTTTAGQEASLSVHGLKGEDDATIYGSSQTSPSGGSSLSISTDLLSGLAAGVFGPLISVLGSDGTTLDVPVFGIALKALATDSNVHVMGNPALLVLDHEEAVLSLGRTIPFPTSNTLTAYGTVTSYDRIDVATELTVTPHVNDANLVTLEVELVVDEVDNSSSESDGAGGPVTSGRSVSSRVMVEDGQTVVIAGVTSTKLEVSRTKVPILGDIPVLGLLFRGKRTDERHSNLLVFLTPYIVEHPRDVLRVRRIKEAQRQEFIRRFQGKEGEAWLEALQGLVGEAHDGDDPGDGG